MSSSLWSARTQLILLAGGLLSVCGCANMVESRAITAFTQALQEQDTSKARDLASDRFEQKALRLDESIDDFAVLRLPKGEINIVSVEEISENEKRVVAEVGERKERIKYRLTRDAGTRKWVVDDIHIRQKKGNIVSTRSVTELMDLVTSVREFLKSWSRGGKADMLALAAPELADVLKELPPEYIASLAKMTLGDKAPDQKIKPEAQIDDDAAVVKLSRKSGQMLISFRKEQGHWLIRDVAVENKTEKEKQIPSVRQLAIAMHAAVEFLDAYAVGDKERLKNVSKPNFFSGSLESSDLNLVRLPTASAAAPSYQLRLDSGVADFIVTQSQEVLKMNLLRVEGEDSKTAVRYLVNDVSIYDLEDNQEKRLSALFTSREIVDAFATALSERDLETLLLLATSDFKRRVWNRVDELLLSQLPLLDSDAAEPHVITTVFSGAVTEISVRQGGRVMIYVLHDKQGRLFIDDVMMPTAGRPNSLKQTLDVMVSMQRFNNALADENLNDLQRLSSRELNRFVWHTATTVPNIGMNPLEHLNLPLSKLEVDDVRATAVFGDDRFGSKVSFVREGEQLVVDDVQLIAGLEAKHRVAMRDAMRLELSKFRGQRSDKMRDGELIPAGATASPVEFEGR